MDSEQTNGDTFRVTQGSDGRCGVALFVRGRSSIVLWLDSDEGAAQRLAHHLETQVDRVSEIRHEPAGAFGK